MTDLIRPENDAAPVCHLFVTPLRIAQVCTTLGFRPTDRDYGRIAEIASRGWPPFRIAQYLALDNWRDYIGT